MTCNRSLSALMRRFLQIFFSCWRYSLKFTRYFLSEMREWNNGIIFGFGEKLYNGLKSFYSPNKITSHQVATVPMALFDLKLTSNVRSALHFRYSIVIEAWLGIASLFFYLHSEFAKKNWSFLYLQNAYIFCSIQCN